ncbi:hypothetical protein L917_11625 [Phytophthora nicotianae]|uniref:Uncharacterized protein n=1 Tax=Phytophthora nicotianae TaxID=4792 RepID=W2KYK8_PHYNI|nr:hypothetical protein L917_11625 [Phytophthora nicotianae]
MKQLIPAEFNVQIQLSRNGRIYGASNFGALGPKKSKQWTDTFRNTMRKIGLD